MIDPAKCEIELRPKDGQGALLALVSFTQDGTKLRGFRLKDGPYGLWLEEPKIRTGKGWISIYFDEDKARFKALQDAVVAQYQRQNIGREGMTLSELEEVEKIMEQPF
ncbi:MAG: hypothetical protein WCO52_01160 [bacterium]